MAVARTWRSLVTKGSPRILGYPRLLIAPGVVMSVTVLALNFRGGGLRDALDPLTRKD